MSGTARIENKGYTGKTLESCGMSIVSGHTYTFSAYSRNRNFDGVVTVSVTDEKNRMLTNKVKFAVSKEWENSLIELGGISTGYGKLVIEITGTGILDLDCIQLYDNDYWGNDNPKWSQGKMRKRSSIPFESEQFDQEVVQNALDLIEYYVQKMFGTTTGEEIVPVECSLPTHIFASATKSVNYLCIKLVNTGKNDYETELNLKNIGNCKKAKITTLQCDNLKQKNTIEFFGNPEETICPKSYSISIDLVQFYQELRNFCILKKTYAI